MISTFLTSIEIADLTHRSRRASQRAVLNAMGIQHKVRPDGTLVVSRAHVEKELGGTVVVKGKKTHEPNWDALANA